MSIPVFLSHPQPFVRRQQDFVDALREQLDGRGLRPRTLGVTDYDLDEPLTAIRRLMRESNGVITIAFRRARIDQGTSKPDSDIGRDATSLAGTWLTSPWAHIEPAMAFQLGLPILILRESGVVADGMLERGIAGVYLPEFDLDEAGGGYLESQEARQMLAKWEAQVRAVVDQRGRPPKLY